MMKVTLSLDDDIVAQARQLAQAGTSLDRLVQEHLEQLIRGVELSKALAELESIWEGESPEREVDPWSRKDLYARSASRNQGST